METPTIDNLTARAYTVPTDVPEADGTLSWNSTTLVLVQAYSGDTVGTGWTYGPPACASIVSGLLSDVVRESNAFDVGGCFDAMVKQVRNAGRQGAVGYAISAVDVALWDLKARLLDLPLHRLLGAVRDDVPVYGSGGFTTYTDAQQEQQLNRWVHDQHLPRVKIKIGEDWGNEPGRDLSRMRDARRLVGDDVELFVDANGAYSRKQAVRVLKAAEDVDVHWIEEPVSSDDLEGLRQIRMMTAADVAAGEYGFDVFYFRRMCAAGAVDCLQIDASRCGGITNWLKSAAVAEAFGLEVSGHCSPHLHVHAAAATSNFRHLEWFHDHVRIEEKFFDGTLDPTGGAVRPDPVAPGNGIRVKTNDIERWRVL
ncbi:enolase C-terminal domain-like protein [Spelaeicoccus albus]|uniref:L-alanine-DL-glutamate epimerase-like enolase superfamily enzyme n=1 Tax=Spelaeicoccus albus TaxID=1280376 RepID=A0A7Z0IIU1_9MICO|nr:enolase C-terminal domain-like protein [Spelaeicoccus albus]NYI68736.1 L-alanine-DL-glutamate epimerase-like enolase superfamily enzyme [Spelaeicoccus albus]